MPLIKPQPNPTPSPAAMPTQDRAPAGVGRGASAPPASAIITLSAITPEKTSTEPTDRSMPAVMITNVIPTDSVSATEASMKIVLML